MRRSERLFLTVILIAGATLRLWGLTFGLPHSEARPDETTIVITATGLLYGGLNPHFFNWPSFEFYLVSAIYRIGWEIGHLRGLYRLKFDMYKDAAVHAAPFLLVPRVLSVVAGVATIWLVYKLVERLFDRLTGITSAFFVAVAFLHVRDSHFGVTDVPMTALVVAALLALSRAIDDPTRVRRWVLCGAVSGLAASTKYNGGLVLAAGVGTAMVTFIRSEPGTRRKVLLGTTALVISALIAFLCGTPYAILDAPHFLEGLRFDFSHLMEGHGIVLNRGWMYHLTFSLWYGLGAPLLAAGLAGMLLLLVTSWKKAVLILTFPVLYYVMVGRGYTVFVRYITPLVPFLCITAAVFVVWIARQLSKERLVPAVAGAIAIVISLPSLQRALAFDSLIGRTDTRELAVQWVSSHVGAEERVGQIPPVLVYPEFGVPRPANLATFDINRKAFITADGATVSPDWIIVPTSPLSAYTVAPDELASIANRDYVRETTIPATHGREMSGWFDQQDLFFMPFTTFSMRDRPGPEIQIFRKRR
jgi:dolichyl-phosphate-mannose-protein mannosyltransferase